MGTEERNSMLPYQTDIDREDVLLLMFDAYNRVFGKSGFNGITRLEKLIFLLGSEGGAGFVADKFAFRPYKFGPYSKGVYEAAEFLRGIDLVDVQLKPYYSYFMAMEQDRFNEEIGSDEEEVPAPMSGHEKVFMLTEQGKIVAEKLRTIWGQEHPDILKGIDEVVQKYGSLPLNQIIRYVYRRYPEMAKESIHPEAKRLPNA
jgi:hypothetical protein